MAGIVEQIFHTLGIAPQPQSPPSQPIELLHDTGISPDAPGVRFKPNGNTVDLMIIEALAIGKLRETHARLCRARSKILQLREAAQTEMQQWSDLQKRSLTSQEELVIQLQELSERCQSSESQRKLLELHEEAQRDCEAVGEQTSIAKNAERQLGNAEHQIGKIEDDFFGALMELLDNIRKQGGVDLNVQSVHEPQDAASQSPVSPVMAPVLEEYYDKAGDVGLIKEQLADLEIDYQEASARRRSREELGSIPSRSQTHYENIHLEAKAVVEQALRDAIRGAELAKQECIKTGINPDELMPTEPLQEAEASPDLQTVDPKTQGPIVPYYLDTIVPWAKNLFGIGFDRTRLSDNVPKQQRIIDWAEAVEVTIPRRHSSCSHLSPDEKAQVLVPWRIEKSPASNVHRASEPDLKQTHTSASCTAPSKLGCSPDLPACRDMFELLLPDHDTREQLGSTPTRRATTSIVVGTSSQFPL